MSVNSNKYPSVAELIPHRGVMRLIDEVLELDEGEATTASIVRNDWPLINDGLLGQTLLIEIAAQTVAVVYGWRRLNGKDAQEGYLVGVKNAKFQAADIPVGSKLTTRVWPLYEMDSYGVFKGTVHCGDELAAEAEIQVLVKLGSGN